MLIIYSISGSDPDVVGRTTIPIEDLKIDKPAKAGNVKCGSRFWAPGDDYSSEEESVTGLNAVVQPHFIRLLATGKMMCVAQLSLSILFLQLIMLLRLCDSGCLLGQSMIRTIPLGQRRKNFSEKELNLGKVPFLRSMFHPHGH